MKDFFFDTVRAEKRMARIRPQTEFILRADGRHGDMCQAADGPPFLLQA